MTANAFTATKSWEVEGFGTGTTRTTATDFDELEMTNFVGSDFLKIPQEILWKMPNATSEEIFPGCGA